PDGRFLAATTKDQTVKIWDMSSEQLLRSFSSSAGRPWSLTWSGDQRLLACGTDEGTTLLWEVETGKCLTMLRHDRPYERMNISDATGITQGQRASLKSLGAIEQVNAVTARF